MKTVSDIFLAVLLFTSMGCGSFEQWRRADQSPVAVLRNLNDAWPMFAYQAKIEVEAARKKKNDLAVASAKAGVQTEARQLYAEMDQINASLRTIVVSEYALYINTELEPDVQARNHGRDKWRDVLQSISEKALDIRKINSVIEQAAATKNPHETRACLSVARNEAFFLRATLSDPSGKLREAASERSANNATAAHHDPPPTQPSTRPMIVDPDRTPVFELPSR